MLPDGTQIRDLKMKRKRTKTSVWRRRCSAIVFLLPARRFPQWICPFFPRPSQPRTIAAKESAFADFRQRQGGQTHRRLRVGKRRQLQKRFDRRRRERQPPSCLSCATCSPTRSTTGCGKTLTNSFENAKVSTKSKLEQQKRSYKPFSAEDRATIFDPVSTQSERTSPIIAGCRSSCFIFWLWRAP